MKDIWLLPFLSRTFEWQKRKDSCLEFDGDWFFYSFSLFISIWFQLSCCAKWFRSFESFAQCIKNLRKFPRFQQWMNLKKLDNIWTQCCAKWFRSFESFTQCIKNLRKFPRFQQWMNLKKLDNIWTQCCAKWFRSFESFAQCIKNLRKFPRFQQWMNLKKLDNIMNSGEVVQWMGRLEIIQECFGYLFVCLFHSGRKNLRPVKLEIFLEKEMSIIGIQNINDRSTNCVI